MFFNFVAKTLKRVCHTFKSAQDGSKATIVRASDLLHGDVVQVLAVANEPKAPHGTVAKNGFDWTPEPT